MPISLRLPADIEAQIASFGSRTGLTKSAVIVRSIQDFLARHDEPSSFQIYETVMQDALSQPGAAMQDLSKEGSEPGALKRQARDAIRNKHRERSERATRALATPPKSSAGSR